MTPRPQMRLCECTPQYTCTQYANALLCSFCPIRHPSWWQSLWHSYLCMYTISRHVCRLRSCVPALLCACASVCVCTCTCMCVCFVCAIVQVGQWVGYHHRQIETYTQGQRQRQINRERRRYDFQISHDRVMSHTRMSHGPLKWVMAHKQWVMAHTNEIHRDRSIEC